MLWHLNHSVLPRRNKLRLFRFFYAKNQSLASLFLLFRKKARSPHLFVCKRTHDGSLSLPPFYEYAFDVVSSELFCFQEQFWINDLRVFEGERAEHSRCEKKRGRRVSKPSVFFKTKSTLRGCFFYTAYIT